MSPLKVLEATTPETDHLRQAWAGSLPSSGAYGQPGPCRMSAHRKRPAELSRVEYDRSGLIERPKIHERGTPSASRRAGEPIADHLGEPTEHRMHGAPQCTRALAMDDTDFENTPLATRSKVVDNEVFHLARLKRVKIESAVDWIRFARLRIIAHAPSVPQWMQHAIGNCATAVEARRGTVVG